MANTKVDNRHSRAGFGIMCGLPRWLLFGVAVCSLDRFPMATCFTSTTRTVQQLRTPANSITSLWEAASDSSSLSLSYDPEDEVKRRLERAKEVLAKSKAKMEKNKEAKDSNTTNGNSSSSNENDAAQLPFFAAKKIAKDPKRRDQVIKAKDEKTGLVQADGEKMAAMSEQEEWEFRSLLEVFENEMDENSDVYSMTSKQLAKKDVVASIWNLRKLMKTEDYMRIFDKKNYFIGEDN